MAHHAQPIAMTAGTELRAPALADSRLRGWLCGARAVADAADGKGKERVEEPDPRSSVWRRRRTRTDGRRLELRETERLGDFHK